MNYHCDSCPPLHRMTPDPPPEAGQSHTSAWDLAILGFLLFSCFYSFVCPLTCMPVSPAELFRDIIVTDCRDEVFSNVL